MSNSGTSSVTITGTVAQINTLLSTNATLELASTPIIWNKAFTGWRRCVDALLMSEQVDAQAVRLGEEAADPVASGLGDRSSPRRRARSRRQIAKTDCAAISTRHCTFWSLTFMACPILLSLTPHRRRACVN